MMLFARGSVTDSITPVELDQAVRSALAALGSRQRVFALPPDGTRSHSMAGPITDTIFDHYGSALQAVMPALGTHAPMSDAELGRMFRRVPRELIRVHDFRRDVVTLGTLEAELIHELSDGVVSYPWPAQVNRLLVEGAFDLILSIGQVVPHEVAGMANHAKNVFVGTGGAEGINKSHFLGAVYGMERIMGRAENPVRRVLDLASERFASALPIVYVLTVVGPDGRGGLALRGLFIGSGRECFERAAALALEVNFTMLDAPLEKVVVYLDPDEYKSTWLGNKSIYRTRMAIADQGELIVLGPGVRTFGEDGAIDALIRKYGYSGTPSVLAAVDRHDDLKANLSAAAHLIHGSSEGRFRVTYCPGGLSRAETESAGFSYASLEDALRVYDPGKLCDGENELGNGERVFYIGNPALGLWAFRDRFAAA
jgi:nickel-dependent lactate racemase